MSSRQERRVGVPFGTPRSWASRMHCSECEVVGGVAWELVGGGGVTVYTSNGWCNHGHGTAQTTAGGTFL